MNLFSQIEVLPMIGDWCPLDKAKTLAAMVLALRPAVVVEIGVWRGSSLLPMALALKELGRGQIVGVDPYSAAASVQGQVNPADAQFWGQSAPHEAIFNEFMGRLDQYQLHDQVRLVRKTSNEVVPPDMDLFHCDGNHGEQATRDIQRYSAKVRQGGFVVLDDLDWAGGAVGVGAQWLVGNGFKELYKLGTGAVYQRLR